MSATISVVIPTFNRPALVQEAVQGVLDQQCDARFEIIVVDDGSTPETGRALQPYFDRIRYVRQENAGLNPARNHGLRLATGDYIALLDDDDVWLPFKTQLLLSALQRFPSAGFVHSNFHIWKPASDSRRADGLRSWFPRPFPWDEMYAQRVELAPAAAGIAEVSQPTIDVYYGDLYRWSLYAPMVLPSTAIIRRGALTPETRFPEVDSVGDWEFFARLSQRCGGVFVPVETTLNRSHEDAVRLTRVDPSLRLRRRIGLVHRLWRQDAEFMTSHGAEVEHVEADCLRRLARLAITCGDGAAARRALQDLRSLDRQFAARDVLLWLLARASFGAAAVGALRSVRARISG